MLHMIARRSSKYYTSARQHANRLNRHLPRRWYMEVAVVLAAVMSVLVAMTLLTPYRPDAQFVAGNSDQSGVSYFRAKVLSVEQTSMRVMYLDGPKRSQVETVEFANTAVQQKTNIGETILVGNGRNDDKLYFVDRYRLPGLAVLAVSFMGLVLLVGRRRGLTSLIGLAVSIAIICWFIIPLIVAGHNPLLITIAGSYMIALSATVIAHGWRTRTFIAVGCMAVVLAIVAVLSEITVGAFHLLGVTEESVIFLMSESHNLNMSGILTGGIIIASLGVLDDIVTAQVATVEEIHKANRSYGVRELYRRASSVGGEHIAALVNTLVLVYVGAALPSVVAMWAVGSNALVQLNSEFIATEIVRTVVASAGLVLSVPVSTLVAAIAIRRLYIRNNSTQVVTK